MESFLEDRQTIRRWLTGYGYGLINIGKVDNFEVINCDGITI
jgi:hypothetical protein